MIQSIILLNAWMKIWNECLSSLYNQTLKNLEVLVINDGSTDDTESNVISFKESHPDFNLILITVEKGGAAKARNIGIKKATSRYIGFIDADDTVDKSMFEEMLLTAVNYDADIISCDFYLAKKYIGIHGIFHQIRR